MSRLITLIITVYQGLFNVKTTLLVSVFGVSYHCRHQPSCSVYVRRQIEQNGTIVGLWRGCVRVFSCW
ncbi:MAG: hypothetical protein COU69_02565 [Candidatus Pacebacteria bacterium CG10_big_fil_rev_8_21_14_0_10_56_10]|nr:MAG: hypothetical protein COU69_02565 [Candidatus Pacebacteria bacterium CG10_big_fil_rev_8_21_14_0_10_56_10]